MTDTATTLDLADWRVSRVTPPLQPGDVQLWRLFVPSVDRATLADDVAPRADAWSAQERAEAEAAGARLAEIVTDEERTRRDRFRKADDRRRFARARGLLRTLLASQLGAAPLALTFVHGPSGKPALPPDSSGTPSRLRFNVSHSHEWILVGLTLDQEIGVDVEHHNARGELLELARRFFSAHEVAALDALPPAARDAAFYAIWACKESFVKVTGQGISAGLDRFSVRGAAEGRRPLALCWEPGDGAAPDNGPGMAALGAASDWTIRQLAIGPEYAAAVAVEHSGTPEEALRWRAFEWR